MKDDRITKGADWLAKDLKKIILISAILIIILVGLSIVNLRTNFLAAIAETIIGRLIGQ